MRLELLLLGVLFLTACGHRAAPETGASVTGTGSAPAVPAERSHTPRIIALPFRLDVTVSAEAIEALDASGRRLAIEADYYGKTRTGAAPIRLGGERRQISARNQSITLPGAFDVALATREASGDPRVKVSAATEGASEGGPVLYCTEFDEALTIAVESGGHIHCELLSR